MVLPPQADDNKPDSGAVQLQSLLAAYRLGSDTFPRMVQRGSVVGLHGAPYHQVERSSSESRSRPANECEVSGSGKYQSYTGRCLLDCDSRCATEMEEMDAAGERGAEGLVRSSPLPITRPAQLTMTVAEWLNSRPLSVIESASQGAMGRVVVFGGGGHQCLVDVRS